MVAEPNPSIMEFDLDSFDDELTRRIDQASASSGRLVLRRGGVPVALVVPVPGIEEVGSRQPDWSRIRAVLGEASARFADVPIDELEKAVAAAADEASDAVWRDRTSSSK